MRKHRKINLEERREEGGEGRREKESIALNVSSLFFVEMCAFY